MPLCAWSRAHVQPPAVTASTVWFASATATSGCLRLHRGTAITHGSIVPDRRRAQETRTATTGRGGSRPHLEQLVAVDPAAGRRGGDRPVVSQPATALDVAAERIE